jgi:hypothetical protein
MRYLIGYVAAAAILAVVWVTVVQPARDDERAFRAVYNTAFLQGRDGVKAEANARAAAAAMP